MFLLTFGHSMPKVVILGRELKCMKQADIRYRQWQGLVPGKGQVEEGLII